MLFLALPTSPSVLLSDHDRFWSCFPAFIINLYIFFSLNCDPLIHNVFDGIFPGAYVFSMTCTPVPILVVLSYYNLNLQIFRLKNLPDTSFDI